MREGHMDMSSFFMLLLNVFVISVSFYLLNGVMVGTTVLLFCLHDAMNYILKLLESDLK